MFGKPEWFRAKTFGWGLVPVTWQGWCYTAIWLVVLLAPFFFLLQLDYTVEAVIWLMAMIAGMVWDARLILKAIHAPAEDEDLFVIDENETESRQFATQNYEIHIRD